MSNFNLTTEIQRSVDRALAEGWVKDPYVPKAAPSPDAHLYESAPEAKGKKAAKE